MPLIEVVGSGTSAAPEQIAATGLKAGRIAGLTVIVSVAVVAHCPAAGVNVYVVVAVCHLTPEPRCTRDAINRSCRQWSKSGTGANCRKLD
jgi:hypothetical protein